MTENTTTVTADETVEYEKGSWGDLLQKSTALKERGKKATKQSGAFLWNGAQGAIEDWQDTADNDPSGEGLYEDVIEALGRSRKGDASKIKTVGLAVVNNGLVLGMYENLSKAYTEAIRLTKTVVQDSADDDAAEAIIAELDVPKTASTVESAAAILLSKGIDGAVVALFDTLGDAAAIRSFLRAATTEAAARAKAAADEVKAEKDAAAAEVRAAKAAEREAARAEREAAKPKAAPKPAAAKPKAAAPAKAAAAKPKAGAAKPVARPKPAARPKA